MSQQVFQTRTHTVDLCVIGGGMAGVCAAVAAARQGARVVLMHERPVLGGNASSEIRMHICGADRGGGVPNMRETGILEELRLENLRRNPHSNYSVWDTVLYTCASTQPNLTLLLNCSCLDATMAGTRVTSVTGWQLTTQTYQTVEARIFMDCSGDGILAPLTGAEHRIGREGRAEFGESIAPEVADRRTMGMTCLFKARQYDTPQPFEPYPWAATFEHDDDLPYGAGGHKWFGYGYWWIELGGEDDSIHDTETLRDELLKLVYGVWDHIKNRGDHGAEHWALEWISFLPGKRESRRYVGDHLLTQLDIEAEGRFDDIVAYGGWSMDDHHPAGFRAARLGHRATIFHPAPSPYGIPYRILYSKNIDNLMFAGRNVSCTHAAMSSTRVMGTTSVLGQAAGTAAALAIRKGLTPRGLTAHTAELQQALLRDDCYLPWVPQVFSPLTMRARLDASQGDPAPLRDGINRPVGDDPHAWSCRPGDWVALRYDAPVEIAALTLIVDSELEHTNALSNDGVSWLRSTPPRMPRTFRIEGWRDGAWVPLATVSPNYQRLVRLPIAQRLAGIRFVLDATWGADHSLLFAIYVD